jgi:hypothetical protein
MPVHAPTLDCVNVLPADCKLGRLLQISELCVQFLDNPRIVPRPMSAIGPKRTSLVAPHMSALGGKADMACCGNPLSRSLLGAKRTCPFALHMSANDPKRTFGPTSNLQIDRYDVFVRGRRHP